MRKPSFEPKVTENALAVTMAQFDIYANPMSAADAPRPGYGREIWAIASILWRLRAATCSPPSIICSLAFNPWEN
jgi:hypothetical protein